MQIHSLSLSSLLCFYFRSVSRDFVHSWSSVILLACEWASERASKHVLLSSYPVCRADLVRCYNVISADLRCCCCCCVSLPVILFFHSTTQNSSSTVKTIPLTRAIWESKLLKGKKQKTNRYAGCYYRCVSVGVCGVRYGPTWTQREIRGLFIIIKSTVKFTVCTQRIQDKTSCLCLCLISTFDGSLQNKERTMGLCV